MSKQQLRQAILEYEEDYERQANGTGPAADTASALLAWARGEEIDPDVARRMANRVKVEQ